MLHIVLFICLIVLATVYLIGKYNENYWKRRGITFHSKNRVMGVFWDFLTQDRPLFQHFHDLYKKYPDEPAVGIGAFLTPSLYIRDPTDVQHVLATDFNSFSHRGFDPNDGDILAHNILFLNGKKWKLVRQSLSPLFTSSKLKSMYYIMDKSAQDFVAYLKQNPKLMKGNCFETLSTFCSAAICAAVFGISTPSVFDSPFLRVAQKAFKSNLIRDLKFSLSSLSESMFKFLNVKFFDEYEDFFIGAIKQVLRQRESEDVKKYDFADICVALKRNGMLKDSETGLELEPTDELFAAQAFFFFVAGVEPTAAVIFATLVELGQHPEILQRIHKEIDDVFKNNDGKLSYDTIVNMEYLDMVMNEAIRIHPPIGYLTRKCVQESVLPNTNIKIEKESNVFTPIYEFHHDPKYHANPEMFDPERFSRENKTAALELTYFPFGKGKRICLGKRYATLQAKAGLVHLLREFTIKTHILKDGIEYKKDAVQVRLKNVNVEIFVRD